MATIKAPKKLIEVALPLDAINTAAAKEKSIRHGHPSTLHIWWARRPLAAARAVLFAQMVNDPGYQQGGGFRYGVNKERATLERERLFKIIEDLVKWENTTNEEVIERARAEIRRSWRETCELNRNHPQAQELFNQEKLPGVHDPFAGGGAIPLEAQRLGLDSFATDLNPVAVTLNKAMIEIPPLFAGRTPVGAIPSGEKQSTLHEDWSGAKGLAVDVRRYAAWMRERAGERLGDLYPKIKIDDAMAGDRSDLKPLVGKTLTVIAWLWARTVKSPNPAFSHVDVPLSSTFLLSGKVGSESYVQPLIEGDQYRFVVKTGTPPDSAKAGTKEGRGGHFRCLLSGSPIPVTYIREQGQSARMGQRLMAIVADGPSGRLYLSPDQAHEVAALHVNASWKPESEINYNPRDIRTQLYGLTKYSDLFTSRQLTALSTLADLVKEATIQCRTDAVAAGMMDDGLGIDAGGRGATAYAEAIGLYLALTVSRSSDRHNSLCSWDSGPTGSKSSTGSPARSASVRNAFSRQSLAMTWDFAEGNPLGESATNFQDSTNWVCKVLDRLPSIGHGEATQADAQRQTFSQNKVVSTDPPYYDNIGYADLSDFFYVWLRKSLREIFPGLYATLAVPKAEELVATPYRHGGNEKAEAFFLDGMTRAMQSLAVQAHPAFPVTIYYAFKQAETTSESGTSSTGWETFLEAVLRAGFSISGTWPMRTELGNRMVGSGTNALASSIILVCRKRATDAETISRREFIRELNAALPIALDEMTRGGVNSPVAPVDLSQAIIGPGMAIFSQYAAVLEADGTPMRVKTALQLINRFLAEDDFDHDTQFCLHWFEQQGWAVGKFGEADVLARAKGTSVAGLQATGVVESGKGDLRLLRSSELPRDWSPETDTRLPVWEAMHHMIRALNQDGESAAGVLLARMPGRADTIRSLAYRLYTLCERKGWTDDARAYNELVTAWSGIEQAAGDSGVIGSQAQLDI
jgi:putative DNA methylase